MCSGRVLPTAKLAVIHLISSEHNERKITTKRLCEPRLAVTIRVCVEGLEKLRKPLHPFYHMSSRSPVNGLDPLRALVPRGLVPLAHLIQDAADWFEQCLMIDAEFSRAAM